jgi:hypothetical protein
MKYKDWSDFIVHCAGIHEIMSKPKNLKPMTEKQLAAMEKLQAIESPTDKERASLDVLLAKQARWNDPELSAGAMKYLLRRYAWEKYHKKVAATGFAHSAVVKGNELEALAIKAVSELDGIDYAKCMVGRKNDYLQGRCDVHHPESGKIIDVKTVWSVNTFLPTLTHKLEQKYLYQMQGYMELYDVEEAHVCYVLLNTPPYLVDREAARYTERYVFGEITRERYEEEMERLDLSFNYDKIPQRRRVIRHIVKRDPGILQRIYSRVNRCREWLNDFERIHMNNKPILNLPDYDDPKEDNIDADSADSR